jgi:hypothetical protein
MKRSSVIGPEPLSRLPSPKLYPSPVTEITLAHIDVTPVFDVVNLLLISKYSPVGDENLINAPGTTYLVLYALYEPTETGTTAELAYTA